MFSHTWFDRHERVLHACDSSCDFKAIIAIHNTNRGPALGGCRVWTYDDDDAALADALRLSRGMTYKSAMADLPLGGGKSVMIVKTRGAATPAMFEALGRAIEDLSGKYIVAEDVGSTPEALANTRKHTRHVTGLDPKDGGRGDPSPTTSRGCFIGLEATAKAAGFAGLEGVHVALQGLGNVGYGLAERLAAAGARLTVADISPERVAQAERDLGAASVGPEEIAGVEADIFSPNALGAVLNAAAIAALKVKAVAGAANNQLATAADDARLRERGILYAPDYVLNAGGVIKMAGEYYQWDEAEVDRRTDAIADRLAEIFAEAERTGEATGAVADRLAEARFGR